MSWTDRQQAMLRAMGLRLWLPAAPEPAPAAAAAPKPLPAAVPAASGVAAPVAAPVARPITAPPLAPPLPRPHSPPPLPAPTAAPALTPQRSEVATFDWPALREAVAACTACGLCNSRTQTVFGTGHERAHWMVVGEAPGEQEDLSGQPFVGPAGQLLDRMLTALKLTRSVDGDRPPAQRVFVANTLKCRPPSNRNPSPEEMLQCEPFLHRQIELVQPRIILAMGVFAVKALLRSDEPLGRLRGRVHRYHGVPLVVTYHPSYLLRQPMEKAKSWEDLCLASATAAAGEGGG